MRRWVCIALVLLFAVAAGADSGRRDLRYPTDLAFSLLSEGDVARLTQHKKGLEDASEHVEILLKRREVPFGDLAVSSGNHTVVLPAARQWDVPPYPELDPPPPRGLPPQALELWYKRNTPKQPDPNAFSDIGVPNSTPSALLRPRPTVIEEHAFRPDSQDVPTPFSRCRYALNGQDGPFFQMLVYAGTNSFEAENAFGALKNSADPRETLQGLGAEAFLYRVPLEKPQVQPTPEVPSGPAPPPLGEVKVLGQPRPDLVDPGLRAAATAPAFNAIPSQSETSPGLKLPDNRPKPSPSPEAETQVEEVDPEILVLVAYFPAKSLTLEMALDNRLGSVQTLISMALVVQQKLLEEW